MKITAETEADIKFGYCTEFIIVLNQPLTEKQEHEYKNFLESIGDSIVVVADDEIVKTHVHTNDPGLAIQEALKHGSLSKIKIDNMREEHQEKLISAVIPCGIVLVGITIIFLSSTKDAA